MKTLSKNEILANEVSLGSLAKTYTRVCAETGCKMSAFRLSVWLSCAYIPRGRVVSYAGLGHFLRTSATRAIGSALAVNPLAPDVPCHRVVRSDGYVGGFMGSLQLKASFDKRSLLEAEGVEFTPEERIDPSAYFKIDPGLHDQLRAFLRARALDL